jgi:hypothetical protein
MNFTSSQVISLLKKHKFDFETYRTLIPLVDALYPDEVAKYCPGYKGSGCYVFRRGGATLYVGESHNVDGRVRRHIVDFMGEETRDWMYLALREAHEDGELTVELHKCTHSQRKDLEKELIAKLANREMFNVDGNPNPTLPRVNAKPLFPGRETVEEAWARIQREGSNIIEKIKEYQQRKHQETEWMRKLEEEKMERRIKEAHHLEYWPFIEPHHLGRLKFKCPHCNAETNLLNTTAHFDHCRKAPWEASTTPPQEVLDRLPAWLTAKRKPGRRRWYPT